MPAFASFHERRETDQPARLTPEALRLYWVLQDPLADAVSVMRPDWRQKGCTEREPYVIPEGGQSTLTNDDGGAAATTKPALHPIAAAPLTEPKIGSITVRVDVLEMWEERWADRHEEDLNPDQVRGPPPPDYEPKGSGRSWRRSDKEDILLLHCCGEDRPMRRPRLTIVPSDPDAGFVSVHDYVSAMHRWLMGLRDTIVRADNVFGCNPASDYDKMMVEHHDPSYILMLNESNYAGLPRRGTENQPKYAPGESYLSQLVAKAEAGDLDAAQDAIMFASFQRKDPGLSPQILQALKDRQDRVRKEEIERQVQHDVALWRQSNPDASQAQEEAEAAHFRAPYLAN